MKRFNLRQNKLLFCETIFVIAVIIIAICLILYSSLFSIFNDLRRQNYDETYLLEIYQKEKSNLTNLVLLIKNNDVETISHGIMIDKTQNYYYVDSLYRPAGQGYGAFHTNAKTPAGADGYMGRYHLDGDGRKSHRS